MTASPRPLARLSNPGELVATVPYLLGFVPSESLVAVSLRPPRGRVGLTMRLDLPGPDEASPTDVAEEVVARLTSDRAQRAVVAIYTDAADIRLAAADGEDPTGGRPGSALIAALQPALAAAGIELLDAVLVRSGRWWSYLCGDTQCCPPEGQPVPASSESPGVGLVAAELALDGKAVLGSRADLVAALAPPSFLAAAETEQALDRALVAFADGILARGAAAVRRDALDAFGAALRRYADPPASLDPAEAAVLAAALHDVVVRDQVLSWVLRRGEALRSLLTDLCRATVPPYDAPVCTLLGWVGYAAGEGAVANVAVDRALASEPAYSLALLLREFLHHQVPPREVRRLLRQLPRERARAS